MTKLRKTISILIVLTLLLSAGIFCISASAEEITDISDLNGKKFVTLLGSVLNETVTENFPDSETVYVNSNADMAEMLLTKKADAFLIDRDTFSFLDEQVGGMYALPETLGTISTAFVFGKGKNTEIRNQLDEYIADCEKDGTMDELHDIWYGDDAGRKTVDKSFTGENGTLVLGTNSSNEPFVYVSYGEVVGYEIDLACRFCKAYGYNLEIEDTDWNGIMPGVMTGKYDFGVADIMITEERKENVDYSAPDYTGDIVAVIRQTDSAAASEGSFGKFITSLKDSFENTFISEGRWKMFAGGLGVTLLISALSIIFGTLLGFLIYIIFNMGNTVINRIADAAAVIFRRIPMVVLLMILYYIVFSKSTAGGITISVFGFSVIMSCSVFTMLKYSVNLIDSGQMEAALTLGYNRNQAFFKVVLPQAMKHFMPAYESEIVSLVKETAVVGYIAVQDLTKVSDIIRSRTYEAFFPLISSAVIYFALAMLLVLFVRLLTRKLDPANRKKENILKGIKTK